MSPKCRSGAHNTAQNSLHCGELRRVQNGSFLRVYGGWCMCSWRVSCSAPSCSAPWRGVDRRMILVFVAGVEHGDGLSITLRVGPSAATGNVGGGVFTSWVVSPVFIRGWLNVSGCERSATTRAVAC
jgi:hypothetical protein